MYTTLGLLLSKRVRRLHVALLLCFLPVAGFAQSVLLVDEVIVVTGSTGKDEITVEKQGAQWKVKAKFNNGAIDQEFLFSRGDVIAITIDLQAGDDKVQLNNFNMPSIISCGPGKDDIEGGLGPDVIDGGDGDDTIKGGKGDDVITGGPGKDDIQGDQGNDTIDGGAGDDKIKGGSGSDTIYGGDGEDDIDGGKGTDTIDGGDGDDKLKGGKGGDVIYGGPGDDDIDGGSGNNSEFPDATLSIQPKTPPYATGFEFIEGFLENSLHGQQGWSGFPANRVQVEVDALGQHVLLKGHATKPGDAEVNFQSVAGNEISFTQVRIKPEALNGALSAMLDIDGAAVSLVQDGSNGALYLYDGFGGGIWVDSNKRFSLAGDGFAQEYIPLTVRTDYVSNMWDVWIGDASDSQLISINFGLDTASTFMKSFTAMASDDEDLLLDDFLHALDNPLFADIDRDGMNDSVEIRMGLDTGSNDRELDLDGDGVTNIEEMLDGTHPSFDENEYAGQPIYYVDASSGLDANDGLSAYDVDGSSAIRGPKASIQSAISAAIAADQNNVVIVIFEDSYTGVSSFSPMDKTFHFVPLGDVHLYP